MCGPGEDTLHALLFSYAAGDEAVAVCAWNFGPGNAAARCVSDSITIDTLFSGRSSGPHRLPRSSTTRWID